MAYKNNFFKNLYLILNNQKGNLDLGGSEDIIENSDVDTSSESEDLSTEGLLASLDSESSSDSEDQSTSEGQPEGKEAKEPNQEDDLEARLKGFEVDKSEGESNPVLEELNKLGIIHNGLPVEFEDLEKVKEHLSKGFDYTQKTQELSEARKSFDAEIAQEKESFEAERESFKQEQVQNEQALTNYNVFKSMVADIQSKDPELFEELNEHFTNHQNQAQQVNPHVSKLEQKVQELEARLTGTAETEENKALGEIKQAWEKEVSELQGSFGPKLRSLGIKPDWKKVEQTWSADATNSMSVKNALFAQYGEAIEKAMANKSKLAETRAKVARTGVKTDNNEDDSKMFGMSSGNSYENEAFEILKEL